MAKYGRFDPRNKKKSKDKRGKQGVDRKMHDVSERKRIRTQELTKRFT